MEFEIPPPQERLCRIHGIPIAPSRWRSGHRHTDCARCRNKHASKSRSEYAQHYVESMERRGQLRSRTYGYALFERITGMKLPIGEWTNGEKPNT
jgi:hypothetical protein